MLAIDLVKAPEQVLCSLIYVAAARVIGKVRCQWRSKQLLLEDIDFVEEEDDARPDEPAGVDNGIKQQQALHHTVLINGFEEHLVVLAEGDAEDDRRDVFEAMDPFLALAPLTTNVKHAVKRLAAASFEICFVHVLYAELAHLEPRLVDTRRFRTRSQHVHFAG